MNQITVMKNFIEIIDLTDSTESESLDDVIPMDTTPYSEDWIKEKSGKELLSFSFPKSIQFSKIIPFQSNIPKNLNGSILTINDLLSISSIPCETDITNAMNLLNKNITATGVIFMNSNFETLMRFNKAAILLRAIYSLKYYVASLQSGLQWTDNIIFPLDREYGNFIKGILTGLRVFNIS